jgi:hypothetical protein
LSLYDFELFTDCPSETFGLSTAELWLAVELADSGSGLGFGWGLFLWVSRSVQRSFQVIDSTCIGVLKLLVINGDETIEGSIDGL